MKNLIIKDAHVITMNAARDIVRADILIEGNRIKKIGRLKPSEMNHARIISAAGLTAAPGFVQTHVHLCQVLFRNHADDLELLDWLKLKIWPFEAAHTPASISVSAQMGLAELIQGGTTTIMDMATVRHTDYVFEQIALSGMRAFCGKAMMDQSPDSPAGLQETTEHSLKESRRLIKRWHGTENDRIRYALAPRFVLSCSESLLKQVKVIAEDNQLIIHTHASENRGEIEAVLKQTGMRNIDYFSHIGLMGERLALAHCIWLDDNEMNRLKETGTKVLHCPSANLKLGSGIARIPEMLSKGITVSIGADGAPCNNNLDMFTEMRHAALIQKPVLKPTAITAEQVYTMATLGGAKTLGLEKEIGSIEAGKKADIILMDLNKIHCQPAENIYAQIVYAAKSTDVKTVIIDGKIVMADRKLKTLDETAILKESKKQISKILSAL